MRIVASITQPSVIDQILAHLRARAATAAHGGARSPPSTRGPSGPGATRIPAAAYRPLESHSDAPLTRGGAFGVRVSPTGASDRSPLRPGAHGQRRPDGHPGAAAGRDQAAAHLAALAGSVIAPDVRRILNRARLNFLSCARGDYESMKS